MSHLRLCDNQLSCKPGNANTAHDIKTLYCAKIYNLY